MEKKRIIQSSCSELLVDTAIHEPEVFLKRFKDLMEALDWEASPPLTLELLQHIKDMEDNFKERIETVIYDKVGNRAFLEYGNNGYIHTGFRLDSQCSHTDERCYPLFKAAIDYLNGELIACDGGSTVDYEDWNPE